MKDEDDDVSGDGLRELLVLPRSGHLNLKGNATKGVLWLQSRGD
jgi:hypothetical protein